MGFLVSPGVEIQETDLTNVVPAVSTSIGGICGNFRWGPVDENITIGSEKDLADQFGKPSSSIFTEFFMAAGFLKYGNNLQVRRITHTDAVNADSSRDSSSPAANLSLLIGNRADYDAQSFGTYEPDTADADANTTAAFVAKYPGALGNALKVHVINQLGAASEFAAEFDGDASTADAGNRIHILVEDDSGAISGTAGTVLEKFAFLHLEDGHKDDTGATDYYYDVINNQSQWIWAGAKFVDANSPSLEATGVHHFAGGADGTERSATNLSAEYSAAFGDSEINDVNLIIAGGKDATATTANTVISVASGRKDAVAFVSPTVSETANIANATAFSNVQVFGNGLNNNSYGFADSTALYVYDKYNDKNHYIPAAGHIAGLCANTDNVADTWFSPAGFNRGGLLGIVKLSFNPTQAQRDALYKLGINPIVSFPGQGIVLFGDKTTQKRPSSFDRINVRRLFITLEKAVATAAKFQLFELNDEFTRAQFRNLVEPFLRDVKGRRGITDFLVVCDETNNTSAVIDGNRFVADIYIKPARSINFITLNFIATRTGVEFSEVVGTN